MKNITKAISAFVLLTLLGSYASKAQCTLVLKPNVLTENIFIDQITMLNTAKAPCDRPGKIQQIIIKYRNSFYNGNSPAMKNIQVNIKKANGNLVALAPASDSTVKGQVVAGPKQSYTVTLTFAGDLPQYLSDDQYIEVKGFNDSGNTTVVLNNWIDEIDIVTIR